jgi:capsule polysaccharide export protein KpsE/RkpR
MNEEVEFEEEENLIGQIPQQQENIPGLAKFLMKTGVIKTTKQANLALGLIAIISFTLSLYIFVNFTF